MTYWENVKAVANANLIAYWRLNESSGTLVEDSSDNGYDGTSSNVTWGETGIGDGSTAALFDGSTSLINVYSAGMVGDFDGTAGSVMIWFKATQEVLADDTTRSLLTLATTSSSSVTITKTQTTNQIRVWYIAGGVTDGVYIYVKPDEQWHFIVLTWDAGADEVKVYYDGAQWDETQTGLGTWAGTLHTLLCAIGSANGSAPISVYDGWLAHCAIWDVALTQDQIGILEYPHWITDRDATDIANRESKAFFNVKDWVRIHAWTTYIHDQIDDLTGIDITLNALSTPTMATIPTADNINDLVENIELLREQGPQYPDALGVVELDYDYEAGAGGTAPDYNDVNDWESNLELMTGAIPGMVGYAIHCGVAGVGQDRPWQARFRG